MHLSAVFQRKYNKMFAKLFILAAVAAAAYGQADKIPAGVSPHLCPNYPYCDNSLLAAHNNHQPVPYNAPVYSQPAYSPPAYSAPAYSAPIQQPAAAQYPAGVSPAACPNYPYCSNSVAAAPAPPLPGFSARLYPDGVSASTCPNYPYCH